MPQKSEEQQTVATQKTYLVSYMEVILKEKN